MKWETLFQIHAQTGAQHIYLKDNFIVIPNVHIGTMKELVLIYLGLRWQVASLTFFFAKFLPSKGASYI
jgi:hypothetical protein